MTEKTTTASFGRQDVPIEEKQKRVHRVFESVADKYDVMNDLMSGGLHRVWKQHMVDSLALPTGNRDFHLLDVAGGTGDIAFKAAAKAGDSLYWEVDARYWERHCIKPGMTGLAQVRGHRGANPERGGWSACARRDAFRAAGGFVQDVLRHRVSSHRANLIFSCRPHNAMRVNTLQFKQLMGSTPPPS